VTRRELGLWGVLVATALIGVFAAGEVVVRIARPSGVVPKRHYEPGIYTPDAERDWALLPGYRGVWVDYEYQSPTTVNSLGYRGPEETPERLAAALRVVVLGDSVAFGRGVADGEDYPARLEALLRARGIDAAVFNLAVPGYDSGRERITLEKNVERLAPQVVIVGWFRNDLTDVRPAEAEGGVAVVDGQLVVDREMYEEYKQRISGSGLQRSMLLNFLRIRWKLWRKGVRLAERRERAQEAPISDPEPFAYSLSQLNAIQTICQRRGARFVLVVHPALDELVGSGPGSVPILRAGVERPPWAAETTVVSVAGGWLREPAPEELFQPGDRAHPNARGHDSIAQMLAALAVFEGPRR
jgi:lysophospholipase L1-like esterase